MVVKSKTTLVVKIPSSLHKKLKVLAAKKGLTIAEVVATACAKAK